jgi:hypothetical protein
VPLSPQQLQAAGLSGVQSVSIDPTLAFPSVQIYPSAQYINKESGRYFGNAASPTSYDLDPYFYHSDNDFFTLAKDTPDQSTDYNLRKNPAQDNARAIGLRGPMFLSGWGYSVQGLPVPNASGTKPSGEYEFHQKASLERQRWKTGPVDLRWHDKRKVWVGGHEMLEGYLQSELDGISTAKMKVLRLVEGGSLKNNVEETITVTSRDPSLAASSGTYCMVVDINYEWRPIWVGC